MYLSTHDKPFFPTNFIDKFKTIKSLGFDAFEIDGAVLMQNFEAVKEAIELTSLPVKAVCGGYNGWIGDFDAAKREQGIKDISAILEICEKLNIDGIVVPAAWGMFSFRLPPHVPPRTEIDDLKVINDSLVQLNRVARKTNTTIYLEPLNRYEDHMINHVETANHIIQSGNFSNVSVCMDFFHANIEEAKIPQTIVNNIDKIKHIHLADSHRYQPGDGHIDFVEGFTALKNVGYDGGFAFECRVLGKNPLKAYQESVVYIKQCLSKAGY